MKDKEMHGVCFRTRNDNIYDYYERNHGLCIVYGAGFWGKVFAEECFIKIDYFCDRQAERIKNVNGIPVVESSRLPLLIKESGKRAIIIICAGIKNNYVMSMYGELTKQSIDADVFNVFENNVVFSDNNFKIDGKRYELFEHSFNCGYICGRMTERSVEISLALEYLKNIRRGGAIITEIGAVTPYYFYDSRISDIIDPTDSHDRVNHKDTMFAFDLTGKNILSISTVEHIGTNDYGMAEKRNVIDAIEKIMNEADSYLITAPTGYNEVLDNWVKEHRYDSKVKVLKRGINNHWVEVEPDNFENIPYTPLWANGLIIIRSWGVK